jgi:hypothetical protein
MHEQFQSLIARAGAAGSASGTGKYDAMLDPETRATLDRFAAWCKASGMSEASSRSYRSYMAKALALPDGRLTSDQRSAVRKFARFLEES